MSLFRFIASNIKLSFSKPVFWLCAAMTALICFASELCFDNDLNRSILIYEAFEKKDIWLNDINYSAYSVFNKGCGVWLTMFAPIIAALPYVTTICEERASQSIRYSISRIGKMRYSIGCVSSAFLTGGLVMAVGYAFFGAICAVLFPAMHEYSANTITAFEEMFRIVQADLTVWGYDKIGLAAPVCVLLCQMFLYGGLSALPALVICAFVKNKYIVMCLPFFISYFWAQLNQRLQSLAYADFENINEKLGKMMSISNPHAMLYVSTYSINAKWVLLINFGLATVFGIIFVAAVSRRVDCGE